ncbi:hypothetical protein BH09VER1_BH09VER1_28980 [soil metagenome]
MSRTNTILLCLLAVAAVVFLAIYEPLTESTREHDMAVREGLVMHLDPSKVRVIRVTAGENTLEIKRSGNGWRVGQKTKDRADTGLVDQLLKLASGMRFYDRIEGSEFRSDDDLGTYGLKNPKRKIEFDGDSKQTLFLGKDAVNEDRLYVKTSASRDVYLVKDDILQLAQRDMNGLRDRRLTDLNPDQVDSIIIRRPEGEMELERQAGVWNIVKPLQTLADEKRVNDYLRVVLGLRVLDFVADDSGDLGIYGLTEGQNEISFTADGNERRQTLRMGKDKTGTLFGQFTARDSVFHLPADTMELLKVGPDALRSRRLLPLNMDIIDLIRIRSAGTDLTIARNETGWVIRDPAGARPASEAAVRALIDAMSTAEVSTFAPLSDGKLPSAGLDQPSCTVEFLSFLSENTPEAKAGEQMIASVAFGKPENGSVYARVSGRPELAKVPESVLNAIPLEAKGWASPRQP